jgi:transposase
MERLEQKKINGHSYYFYSKWGWVNGKCRRLWQKYLGKPADIAKAVIDGGPPPACAEVFQFGLPTALWLEAERQNVIDEINKLCPKRHQGLSIGDYLTVAAVNRAIAPVSKQSMWDWFVKTTLRRFLPDATKNALSSQRFWDHMDAVPEATAKVIWRNIISATLAREHIDLSHISYDGTNFYTFISTFNIRCQIARRGKNKQGRNNLRQVSYGLFCSRDGQVPLFYDVYEGNCNDAREFPLVIDRFHDFLKTLSVPGAVGSKPDVTIIFDKGNNSADNIALLDQYKLHFIGSVKLDEHKELASISNDDKRLVACRKPGLESIKAFSLKKTVYGRQRHLLVTFNQKLFDSQLLTVHHDIEKALKRLSELKQRLDDRANGVITRGRAPTENSVEKQCLDILKRPFLRTVVQTTIQPGPLLDYRFDNEALKQISETYLGKKIIITTRESWDHEEIIDAYHSQYVIEHIFRSMKDRNTGSWWPLFHWTDQKIQIHGLYCTIAVLLRAVIHRRVRQADIQISTKRLLTELGDIREVVNIYRSTRRRKKEKCQTVLTKMTEIQQNLVEVLGLKQNFDAV